eukprot:gene34792-42133_t
MSLNPLAQEFVPSFLLTQPYATEIDTTNVWDRPVKNGAKERHKRNRQRSRGKGKGQRQPLQHSPQPSDLNQHSSDIDEDEHEDQDKCMNLHVPKSYASILMAQSIGQARTEAINTCHHASAGDDGGKPAKSLGDESTVEQKPTLFVCKPAVGAVEAHKQRWIEVSHELTAASARQQTPGNETRVLKSTFKPSNASSDMWHHVLRTGLQTQQISDDVDDVSTPYEDTLYHNSSIKNNAQQLPATTSINSSSAPPSAAQWWLAVWDCDSASVSALAIAGAPWEQPWAVLPAVAAQRPEREAAMRECVGLTALHILSAFRNGVACLESLLAASSAVLTQIDLRDRVQKRTALHYACQAGHAEAVALLLKHGADPGIKERNGDTALHMAAERGWSNILGLLLDKASSRQCGLKINARNKKGQHALMLASSREVAQMLVNRGADVTVVDANGRDAVGCAAMKGDAVLLRYLLSANTHARKDHVETGILSFEAKAAPEDFILHDVVRAGQTKSLGILLSFEYYRNLVEISDRAGYTPLLLAAKIGDLDMCTMLIQAKSDVYHRTHNGHSLFSLLALHGRMDCLFQLSAQLRRISAGVQDHLFTVSDALNYTWFMPLFGLKSIDSDKLSSQLPLLAHFLLTGLPLDDKISPLVFGPCTTQLMKTLGIATSPYLAVKPKAECMKDFFPGLVCHPRHLTFHWPQEGNIIVKLTSSYTMVTHRSVLHSSAADTDAEVASVDLSDLPVEAAHLLANHLHGHPAIWPHIYLKPACWTHMQVAANRLGWSSLQAVCTLRMGKPAAGAMTNTRGFFAACRECFTGNCRVSRINPQCSCCVSVLNTRKAIKASPSELWYALHDLVGCVLQEDEEFELIQTAARWHTDDQGEDILLLVMHGLDCACFPNMSSLPLLPLPLPVTKTTTLLGNNGEVSLQAVEEVFSLFFHRLRLLRKAQSHGDILLVSSDGLAVHMHRFMVAHCPKMQAMMHFKGPQAREFPVTMSAKALKALASFLYTSLLPSIQALDVLLEVAAVADEYMLPELAAQATLQIARVLTKERASEVVGVAAGQGLSTLLRLSSLFLLVVVCTATEQLVLERDENVEEEHLAQPPLVSLVESLLQNLRE